MPQNSRFYSNEAREVLEKLPSWIIRWGISIVFIIFVGIIVGSYFIKFPQIITAPITITSVNPPSDLVAKFTGRIDCILFQDGEIVEEGNIVAYLHTTADYNDVCHIEKTLELHSDTTFSFLNQEYQMGEMQNSFSEFRNLCTDYLHYIDAKDIQYRIELLLNQIDKYKYYSGQQKSQRDILLKDLEIEQKNIKKDSLIFKNGVITELEYDRSVQSLLQKKNNFLGFDASITNTELNILQQQQELAELHMLRHNEMAQHHRLINEGKWRLLAEIKHWKEQYVLTAPISGKLTFTRYWSKNQNVVIGDIVATILPIDSVEVIGLMTISSSGFGRVDIGQTVNTRLNGYPSQEYGVLKGRIVRLSSVPDSEGRYIAEISFPDGLKSTYKEQFKFIQKMDGTGDIITKDMRLIERLVRPVRKLFDKAKGN